MNKDINNLERQYQLISEADFTLGPKEQGRDFDKAFYESGREKIISALLDAADAYADACAEYGDDNPEMYPSKDSIWPLLTWLESKGVREKLESLLDDQTILHLFTEHSAE